VGVDGQPYKDSYLSLKPGGGFPLRQNDGVYTVNLLRGAGYEITAKSYCLLGGRLSNAAVSVRIEDNGPSEVTLVMPGDPCPKQETEPEKKVNR